MRRESFKCCFFSGCLLLVTFPAHAQEVVHALCGTVRSIDSRNKTITVVSDSGTLTEFKESMKPDVSLDFDRRIRAEATTPEASARNGDHIVIYYFGSGDQQTAIALEDLGAGPLRSVEGAVIKFDRGNRVLTLRNNSGIEESFHLEPKTVAETPYGAVAGLGLGAKDGDRVQVMSSSANGNETALFIRAS